MVDTAHSGPPSPPAVEPAKRRRRKRPLLYVVGAAILWFIGQGLGWFGAGPSNERGDRSGPGQGAPEPGESVGGGAPDDEPVTAQLAALRGQPSATDQPAPDNGTAAEVATDPEQAKPAAVTPGPVLIADDRFQSLVSLIESHIQEKELGEAVGVLQRLTELHLSKAQTTQLSALQVKLQTLYQATEERVLAHIRKGEVLAADQASQQLIVRGVWQAHTLASAAPSLALGDNWQRAADDAAITSAKPAPLERNRKVRMRWRDGLRVGVVKSAKADQVTVQVRDGGSQSYPTVRAVQCEPTDSSSEEAIEMGFYAVQAGAPRLARLWLLRAHLLQRELTARGKQLLELLR